MAAAVAGARLMGDDGAKSRALTAAIRFATWMLPAHRKEWADATFNEVAYIDTQLARWRWVLGCTLFAVRERAVHELATTFSARSTLRALCGLSAASVMLAVGIFIIQKPYQQERIVLMVLHSVGLSAAHRPGSAP
ncbi:hypothetical protein [Dyella mobilis]|uniref:Uncharacterized protein n=1 Tax=Dyella mobilis TaxID=1849582 RepID=A0ABS2KCG3_9GAMM|nr:hypothetical protein [Dyella mobilis]MBM7128876.1 hypothetical protein [Dyella mobilis]GLQ99434.1 hypothetical protein GCM10007863_38540 [Dyella mobilis]